MPSDSHFNPQGWLGVAWATSPLACCVVSTSAWGMVPVTSPRQGEVPAAPCVDSRSGQVQEKLAKWVAGSRIVVHFECMDALGVRGAIALAVIGAMGLGAASARAQLVYQTITRRVSATTSTNVEFSSTSTGPWENSAQSNNSGNAGANASQTSDLRPDAIDFDIAAFAWNINAFPANSQSLLDVTFLLNSPTPYSLVNRGTPFLRQGQVVLRRGEQVVFGFSGNPLMEGTLQPGTYRFLAEATGTGFSGGVPDMGGEAHFTFSVPSPAGAALLGLAWVGALRRQRGAASLV